MSSQELIKQIQAVLHEVPDEALQEILSYISAVREVKENKENRIQHLAKILREDSQLLHRLAQ